LPLSDELVAQLSGNEGESAGRAVSAAGLRHLVLQLAATARSNGRALRAAQISRVMTESSPATRTTCRHAISLVGKHFGLSAGDLKGKSRQQAVVEARGLAMYLTRMLTGASYNEIGRQFGSRDHTTALHACRKVAALVAQDETTRRLAEELAAQISAEGGG
jgi:chromosomal replication initiation ATPase DnaA